MRGCVRLDARVCSRASLCNRAFRQGCVLAHVLFIIFFGAVIYATYTRFKAYKDSIDVWVHLRIKTETGGGGQQPEEGQS